MNTAICMFSWKPQLKAWLVITTRIKIIIKYRIEDNFTATKYAVHVQLIHGNNHQSPTILRSSLKKIFNFFNIFGMY